MDDSRYISLVMGATALVMLFVFSCAKISSPSGGPRDTEPPVIVKSVPENEMVMFTGKSFTITFDEYVVLDRIAEKFMVSPPVESKPDIRLRGKSLHVTWEDTLTDSTTYTFYFQDAIRDNNENNPIPNFQYVFSTGPVLDSLSLTGNVFNASDLETADDMMVMMYSNLSDTAPRKVIPSYISRPDPSGGFMISNIRPGRYRLYALKDLNGNRLYDLDDEIFAYCDSLITITPESYYGIVPDTVKFKPATAPASVKPDLFTFGLHRLYAFRQELKKQYLLFTERKSAWSLGFGLALPSDTGQFSLEITEAPSGSWYMESNAARDTFMVWITSREIYDRDVIEAILKHPQTDSTGAVVQKADTVILRYHKPAPPRGGTGRAPPLAITTNLNGKVRPDVTGEFRSPAPLQIPDTSKITFTQIIDTIKTEIIPLFERDSMNSRRFLLTTPLKPGVSYSLICREGTFADLFGNRSDSVNYRFNVATEEDFGSLSVSLTGYDGKVIIRLLADREKVLREQFVDSPGKVEFKLLDKGKYRLKAVYDIDSSMTWTTGDFNLGRNPEPVTYYPGELEVKINWALEQDWDLGTMYSKDVALRNKPATKR